MQQNKYDYVIFDLDGTLTDSARGIIHSFSYALNKYNIKVNDKKELFRVVGPPLQDSFMDFYGFSEEETKKAVSYFREFYDAGGMFENEVYPGIINLLERLKKKNLKLLVATSKVETAMQKIMDHFGLTPYFTYMAGCKLDGSDASKEMMIRKALKGAKVTDLSKVVMVGDRNFDIIGAKKVGIDSIGVLYGYGSREELTTAGATYIADSVETIEAFL